MLPWKLRKRHILPVNQNLSSMYFSLAKFQLVSCNLSLAMIWQIICTHKLPKLCSATLIWKCWIPPPSTKYHLIVFRRFVCKSVTLLNLIIAQSATGTESEKRRSLTLSRSTPAYRLVEKMVVRQCTWWIDVRLFSFWTVGVMEQNGWRKICKYNDTYSSIL